jgi:predicted amidohydrolase YtcJ
VLIAAAELEGTAPLDVRVERGLVTAIGPRLERRPGERCLEARGGALLPGLHDHHLHLFALAAARASVRCGPPGVRDAQALSRALAAAGGEGWIRGVGYHESVAGDLDRERLDALAPARPVRLQHRSGALWIVNSAGIEALALERGADARGVERDASGRPTGRLYDCDAWLRSRLGGARPSLAGVGRLLAAWGVTGVSDATPDNDADALRALAAALDAGDLLQRVLVMGGADLPEPDHAWLARGAVKLWFSERELPRFEALAGAIAAAHAQGRPVAVHCVTRTELALALGAFAEAGSRAGDRIEHAALAPPAAAARIAELGLTVVMQPNFVRERGDAYLADLDPAELPWLHRAAGLAAAGIPLGGGTDAPFGDPDPWWAMRAAVERRSAGGVCLGERERLSPERALALFTSPAQAPGAPPRRVGVGAPADLCLLARPWRAARDALDGADVVATLRAGELTWLRGCAPSAGAP